MCYHVGMDREGKNRGQEREGGKMEGSATQVAWAKTLRSGALAGMANYSERVLSDEHLPRMLADMWLPPITRKQLTELRNLVAAQQSASWWIDNGNLPAYYLIAVARNTDERESLIVADERIRDADRAARIRKQEG